MKSDWFWNTEYYLEDEKFKVPCHDCGQTTKNWYDYFTADDGTVRCKKCALTWCNL